MKLFKYSDLSLSINLSSLCCQSLGYFRLNRGFIPFFGIKKRPPDIGFFKVSLRHSIIRYLARRSTNLGSPCSYHSSWVKYCYKCCFFHDDCFKVVLFFQQISGSSFMILLQNFRNLLYNSHLSSSYAKTNLSSFLTLLSHLSSWVGQ